jgi:hypothetical protein
MASAYFGAYRHTLYRAAVHRLKPEVQDLVLDADGQQGRVGQPELGAGQVNKVNPARAGAAKCLSSRR